jgi:hypothetical protein
MRVQSGLFQFVVQIKLTPIEGGDDSTLIGGSLKAVASPLNKSSIIFHESRGEGN